MDIDPDNLLELFAIDDAIDSAQEAWSAMESSDMAKMIPLIGHFLIARRFVKDLRSKLLAAKLAKFLLDPSLQSEQARERMRDRAGSAEAKKIGETLFLVLDKLTDMRKPGWLAKMFAAHLAGDMTASEFLRLGTAIDVAFPDDLIALMATPEPGQPQERSTPWMLNLLPSGLTYLSAGLIGGSVTYHVSPLGFLFAKTIRMHSAPPK